MPKVPLDLGETERYPPFIHHKAILLAPLFPLTDQLANMAPLTPEEEA
jgi:hypothetical protein